MPQDTQAIMSEPADRVHALVQYSQLFDITARGFTRTFCVAYIADHCEKLITVRVLYVCATWVYCIHVQGYVGLDCRHAAPIQADLMLSSTTTTWCTSSPCTSIYFCTSLAANPCALPL